MSRRLAARAVCTVALALCTAVQAAPFAVQVGADRLAIDTPAGFSDSAAFGSPRLTDFAETLADASNRVLVFALSDSDMRKFSAGDQLDLRRYLLAVTARATERERLTAAQFAILLQEASRATGTPPEAGTDFMKYLQGRPTGQAHLLADLRRDGQVLSIMQGTMLPSQGGWNEKRQFRVSAMTIALVGGRALYLSAFSAYDSPADIAWLKTVSERWLEDLQRLNR